ncbi:MAG: PEP-CTERM sorting domain-containing protein [Gemmataceae bacterium]|nr:PEP-CTERM sorting domain-containing protein [Gemmataceae bacterium]
MIRHSRLAVLALSTVALLALSSAAEASFFRNRPVPPGGTGSEKEVDPPPVHRTPEPGTLILATLGAGTVAAWKRRRAAKS